MQRFPTGTTPIGSSIPGSTHSNRVRVGWVAKFLALALGATAIALIPSQAGAQGRQTRCGTAPAGMNIIESDASVIEGTDGNDFICAGPSDNTIRGGDGHDIIYGRAGKDRLIGGAGADVLRGGQGADILRGFRGADELFGNAGRDQLFGGRGKDVLEGGAGNDTLNGGLGRDTLIGGNGIDTIDTGDNSSTHTPVSGEAANVALIQNNPTRNTQYDDNSFRDVPMNQISVSDLTVPGDLYNAAHLDTSTSGFFRVTCEVSHFAYDDPIVFPGQPGAAHLHMFFGNTEANAYSTFDSLLNTGTSTCNGQDLNRTAYWVPCAPRPRRQRARPIRDHGLLQERQLPPQRRERTRGTFRRQPSDARWQRRSDRTANDVDRWARQPSGGQLPVWPRIPNAGAKPVDPRLPGQRPRPI